MRTIIAGSRNIPSLHHVGVAILKSGFHITKVVSGCARGVDQMGEDWAELNGVEVDQYPADWALHGRKAGCMRNVEMADNADALIAVWDGQSRGTAHMIQTAKAKGLKVHVEIIP